MKAGLLFVCAMALNAQIQATVNHLPDGRDEVKIRNDSAIDIIAFGVAAKRATENVPNLGIAYDTDELVSVYSDPLIEAASTPLRPGEERTVMEYAFDDRFGKHHRMIEDPVSAAGILADGKTIGDPVMLTKLILRRQNMLLAVETAREALADAGGRNVPRKQLIEQFKRLTDLASRWYLPREQQVGRSLYQSIIGKLMDLPQGELGSPFPPSSFIEQETAALSRQRLVLLRSQPGFADAALLGK